MIRCQRRIEKKRNEKKVRRYYQGSDGLGGDLGEVDLLRGEHGDGCVEGRGVGRDGWRRKKERKRKGKKNRRL